MRRLSGTHLTIIIVAAMVCLALPMAAVGAGIAKVSIAGPNGKTAKVKSGRLQVASTVADTVRTEQQGPVSVREPALKATVRGYGAVQGGACTTLLTASANAGLVVTRLQIDVWQNTTPGSGNFLRVGVNGCGGVGVAVINPPTVGLFVLDFAPELVLAPGQTLRAVNAGNVAAEVHATGYEVPAGSVPASPRAQAHSGERSGNR